jgi:hypothetical protein
MPVPQEESSFFVERASCWLLRMVQDISFNSHLAPFSITCLGTGKMPVPQEENSFFVERASCPFLTMVQDISFNRLSLSEGGFNPRRVIENDAISQL